IRCSHTHGEEWPTGSGVFQTTWFSGPKWTGSSMHSGATPSALGPRNCGQQLLLRIFWAGSGATIVTARAATARDVIERIIASTPGLFTVWKVGTGPPTVRWKSATCRLVSRRPQ